MATDWHAPRHPAPAANDVAMSDFELPPRKKPKISELPLSSAQRGSIDGMLHTFKKKGEFDALRKKAFQQYNESAARGMFEASLRKFTADEIERDSVKYLKPDRRLAAPLLEGAAARASVYEKTEADVDAYIDQFLANAEQTLREIRRKEIGDEAADAEVQRGAKSEEAYADEAAERRVERARQYAEAEKMRVKKEAQDRKKKELEGLKKKQEELMKETERLQREQKRRQERDEWKKAEKDRERERIRKFNEERERQKQEAEEREKAAQAEREKRQKERDELEQKRLEQEALDLLLREGKELAEKAKRPDLERSESMEPPSRLRQHPNAPRSSGYSKDEMRSQGLMPTSLTLRRGEKLPGVPTGPRSDRERELPPPPPPEDDRRRPSRLRSRTPDRSTYSRTRRESIPVEDDRRSSRRDRSPERYREGTTRRESYYRDLSAEREAWKARYRSERQDREGEEGEVVERSSTRARSRSRESHRRRESPPRRSHRERSRTRSPARRYRDRDDALRRRSRSRSPPGIDRYVPGATAGKRAREDSRERDREPVRRDRDRERREPDRPDRERREPDRDRRESDRYRASRYDERDRERDRPRDSGLDRYIPGSGGRADETKRPRHRDRSRSLEPTSRRERSWEREKGKDKDKDRKV